MLPRDQVVLLSMDQQGGTTHEPDDLQVQELVVNQDGGDSAEQALD